MKDELLLIMLKNFVEDGCWHSDGEGIFEDCANLDCLECFVAKAKPIIEKAERGRIIAKLEDIPWMRKHYSQFIQALKEAK